MMSGRLRNPFNVLAMLANFVFNGVSTKYINNYLAWFKFLQLSKKNKKNDRIKDMLVNVATKDTYVTRATIRNRFIELI